MIAKLFSLIRQCREPIMQKKNNLETKLILLIFLLKIEISEKVVQAKHQNSKKWLFLVRIFLVEMALRLLQPFSVVMTLMQTLLWQLRRSLQMKKTITNGLHVSQSVVQPRHIVNGTKKEWLLGHLQRSLKTAEDILKFAQEKE